MLYLRPKWVFFGKGFDFDVALLLSKLNRCGNTVIIVYPSCRSIAEA